MERIKLPPILPGDLDLNEVNQKLLSGSARLDWGSVISAPDHALAQLLNGIRPDDSCLGIEEHPPAEYIINAIAQYYQRHSEPLPSDPLIQDLNIPEPSEEIEEIETDDTLDEHFEPAPMPDQLPSKILNPPTPSELRAELESAIIKDLYGPAGGEEEEVNEARMTERYLLGVIAPQKRNQTGDGEPEQLDDIAIADKENPEEGATDALVSTSSIFPSSLGMTFCVDKRAKALCITASWGRYERQTSEQFLTDKGNPKTVWKRYPISGTIVQPLVEGDTATPPAPDQAPAVVLRTRMRPLADGDWIVTIFLVNEQTEPNESKDTAWLFQPEISVSSADANVADIFQKKPLDDRASVLDPVIRDENRAMAMLYRHHVEFAVGHGVGVHAEVAPGNPCRAVRLSTRVVPTYEVPATKPPTVREIPGLAGLVLDMKHLSEIASPTDLRTVLQPLAAAYDTWITQQESRLSDPDEGLSPYQDVAQKALDRCRHTLRRIQEGITTLENNIHAFRAFRFMNRAMYLQRIHTLYAEQRRRGENVSLNDLDRPENRSWYPFQLAFILLNVPSITDVHHPDRSHPTEAVADLLWFPTGGGKTEAYLGLTAYTIGLRRLQGRVAGRDGEHGVAVLMRYTLRLLTLQQFQRATALICACEVIRREDEAQWGQEPFRIGLWVGQKNTPNKTADSDEAIKQHRESRPRGRGTPHQLTNCPWCGAKIHPGCHIQVELFERGRGRTFIKCGDDLGKCPFSKGEGLPVIVVDEEIYRRLPTLVIATVDKFAQMPWKGEVQMVFGQVNGYCERHGFRSPDIEDSDRHNRVGNFPAAKTIPHPKLRPPDLIIQDELHLISGPLGTLVGLYETAVDYLCTWDVDGQPVRPKVIASTATIRQAEAQVNNLFVRKLAVFPPQGLDIRDNFFSRQRDNDPTSARYSPGRRYVGICAPGRRLKATMIRVYLAVLSAAQMLYNKYGIAADPWMTLVGYFNSVRELGGTRRLVEDDIRTRLTKMHQRGLANRRLQATDVDELTARKDSTEIPGILDRLETPFDPELLQRNQARRKAGQRLEQPDPLDVLLATNMISVGVDVRRLGVMVVCGQPKNTAEYIQATSRVGRSHPGLVLTVYNWARPRDLSHYERFAHYHATFYQNVEALSVTPFSSGALYRGLSAILVALVRLASEELNGNEQAGAIERNHPYVRAAVDAIVRRAELVGNAQTAQRLRSELEGKIDRWLACVQRVVGGAQLKYQVTARDGISVSLLTSAGRRDWEEFTCLNSLRNVEPTVNLVLTDQPPDDDFARIPQPYIAKP
ncbi:DISARM system helicase DrmA [Synechococcus sp. C9]|uniref:DISARM system helicase DrmA n=1 Tax=Synechococcus sp. C9 TaxID=102119 RepID=UPI001FF5C408|nr:DISARM system helicase DrmA [Synechococcus sp. C9]